MKESMAGKMREKLREQLCRGGVESGIELRGEFRMLRILCLQFGQAEGDRLLNLLREVKVVAGDVRKKRIDEMQPAQVVASGGWHRWLRQERRASGAKTDLPACRAITA